MRLLVRFGRMQALCLVLLVGLWAPVFSGSASADIIDEINSFADDNQRAIELVNFELKVCIDKGMIAPDQYDCQATALAEIYRKIPNSLVGVDLLYDHYWRAVKISELVVMTRTKTVEQGEVEIGASYKMFEAQLARRQKAAKDYVAALVQKQQDQKQAADQAAAEAEQQAKKRKFNDALGELGRQLLQPKVYGTPRVDTQEQVGCHQVGEQQQGFNKICYYECMRGPFALNVRSTAICPLKP
jgi:hypothetical protein